MAHNNIEIEIKVKVEQIATLKDFLHAHGKFQGEKRQVDEYFSPDHGDYMSVRPVNEWLRLREANGRFSLDYKLWHRDKNGQSEFCDEIETGIDSIEQARKILQALHFHSIATVDKVRSAWIYEEYEVAIDEVKDLGIFVEVEYIGKDINIDAQKVVSEMIAFLKSTACGKIAKANTGYPMLLLFPEEAVYQEI